MERIATLPVRYGNTAQHHITKYHDDLGLVKSFIIQAAATLNQSTDYFSQMYTTGKYNHNTYSKVLRDIDIFVRFW